MPDIANGDTIVVAVAVRAVAMVLLAASILVGLTETGDLGLLDNLVDCGVFEATKWAASRYDIVRVGVVASTSNTSDFGLLNNGTAVGVECRVVVPMTAALVVVPAITKSLTDTGDLSLLDDSATTGVKSGITEAAAGLVVAVAMSAVAVVTAVVKGLANTGDLGLLDDGMAVTTVDYSVVTEAAVVAMANNRVALVQGLTEITTGILVHSASNTELAKIFYGVSLVSPLVDSLGGADNGLAVMPVSAVSPTMAVRTVRLVHEIRSR